MGVTRSYNRKGRSTSSAAVSRRVALMLAALIGVGVLAAGLWWAAFSAQVEGLARRGASDLAVAADRLVSQLQRYRELAVLMADHPQVAARVSGAPEPGLARVLQEVADQTGSLGIAVVDDRGRVLSAFGRPPAAPGATVAPYLQRALRDGALGAFHAVEGTGLDQRRTFTYASPVFSPNGPVLGAVVVRADVGAIEAEWRGDELTVFFTDELGVIFATNRSELLFGSRLAAPGVEAAAKGAAYGPGVVRAFGPVEERVQVGQTIWTLNGGPYVPRRALHIARDLPVIEMRGEALVDLAPARRVAWVQAIMAAAAGLAVCGVVLSLLDRRRALADQLEQEARLSAELERRVKERTAALSDANAALRHEVAERLATEAALRRTQDELVQAGKLSALGQMSAGISHELNQPLMAIGSFAENAGAYLDKGRPEKARSNLERIGEMARRMGRIIKNLRAFARQEAEPARAVDLVAVVGAVLELTAGRIRRQGVDLDWRAPLAPVWAMGGEVRLQQVLMNLVSNALDAMEGRKDARLTLTLSGGDPVRLSVADTGSGLTEADRVFDPFYSTKEVGEAEGMGLGLSISYGIVTSFGGTIRGFNRAQGGAVFEIVLPAAEMEQVA